MNNELIIKKVAEDNRELLANPQDILNRAMELQQLLMLYESGIKQITASRATIRRNDLLPVL